MVEFLMSNKTPTSKKKRAHPASISKTVSPKLQRIHKLYGIEKNTVSLKEASEYLKSIGYPSLAALVLGNEKRS